MPHLSFLSGAVAAMAAVASAQRSPAASYNGCQYTVPNTGSFQNALSVSFTGTNKATSLPPQLLVSKYTVGSGTAPFSREFEDENVYIRNDALNLITPGLQFSSPIGSAQVTTAFSDIMYGSVRTVARFSAVPGTTHGMSFYYNDTQEVDINYVTYQPGMITYTNQLTDPRNSWTTYPGAAPLDSTILYHEYRTDWTPEGTFFYIDGVLQRSIKSNVPTEAGLWLWNNWSNGNSFTRGPPLVDNVMNIQSIQMYFNRTTDSTAACSPTVTTTKAPTTTAKGLLGGLLQTLLPTIATLII